jgi:hypothetical protein
MAIRVTDWRGRLTPLDILVNVDGEERPVPFLYGTTTPIFVDVADQLDVAEVPVDIVATCRRLPAKGESEYTDATDKIFGAPTLDGTIISQRLQGLERGAVYRVEFVFGPTGNRRGASMLVECTE